MALAFTSQHRSHASTGANRDPSSRSAAVDPCRLLKFFPASGTAYPSLGVAGLPPGRLDWRYGLSEDDSAGALCSRIAPQRGAVAAEGLATGSRDARRVLRHPAEQRSRKGSR